MKTKLVTLSALLALGAPVARADGIGGAVLSGVISGVISAAAQPRPQPQRPVVVHDRVVVHEKTLVVHKAVPKKSEAPAVTKFVDTTAPPTTKIAAATSDTTKTATEGKDKDTERQQVVP